MMRNPKQSKHTRSANTRDSKAGNVRSPSTGRILTEGYQPHHTGTVVIPQKAYHIVSASGSAASGTKGEL